LLIPNPTSKSTFRLSTGQTLEYPIIYSMVACINRKINVVNTSTRLVKMAASSSDCEATTSKQKQPEIIRFAFKEFTVDAAANKWKAKCSTCRETIVETRGTTTGFSRYVQYTVIV